VDSGDYVATLDRSEANNQLKDIRDEVQKIESRYTKTKLDTTISLRNLRDELLNMKFAMEEAKIRLEQSKYEPPATIRQAEIELEKARRAFEQAKRNYTLKVQQANADMTEVAIELAQQKRKRDAMLEVLEKFVITAPKKGMIIYHKEWGGQKRKVGSTINPWDLTVATLPDLSELVSKTYVNEIDISKVKTGQQVEIGVDAFPGKKFKGMVSQVANIGEQLPNTDAKVFEVTISLEESDPVLRPSMTTSNIIRVKTFKNALSIPLETVFIEDSITFVYMKNKSRQMVELGEANENEIIVEHGLSPDDQILLNAPEDYKDDNWQGLGPLPKSGEKQNQQ
jgi:multidrug efflux pump subunit AcrA (membrane-fusion protein)